MVELPLHTWILDSETQCTFMILKEQEQTLIIQDEWLIHREVNKLIELGKAANGLLYIDGKGWSDGRQGPDRHVEPRSPRAVDPQQPVVPRVPRPPRQPAPKQIVDGIRDALRAGIAAWNQGKHKPVLVSDEELDEDTQRVLTYLKDDKSTLKDSIVLVRLQRLELNLWRDKIKPVRNARHEKREQEKEVKRADRDRERVAQEARHQLHEDGPSVRDRTERGSGDESRGLQPPADSLSAEARERDDTRRMADLHGAAVCSDENQSHDEGQENRDDSSGATIPSVRMQPAPFLKGFRLECSCGHKGLPRTSKEAVMRVDYYKHELDHVKGKA